ncbi:hypothetical protein ACMD2_23610 [Ananas comosus]|uniref:Uncharacterized protein n=1 Tax=Ananas comosus TaxID=4615 RepID=A0A199VP55_ANACO|nr:hypothetical protein ACMD2_23610 [Ananas comosus]
MMENAAEVGDDQGSGWFEVKRRARPMAVDIEVGRKARTSCLRSSRKPLIKQLMKNASDSPVVRFASISNRA